MRPKMSESGALINRNLKGCLCKQRPHNITKIGDSVLLSFFICNNVVREAAYTWHRLNQNSIFRVIDFQTKTNELSDAMGNKIEPFSCKPLR